MASPQPTARRTALAAIARAFGRHAVDATETGDRVRDPRLSAALESISNVLFALSAAVEQAAAGDPEALRELSDLATGHLAALVPIPVTDRRK
jgi:hypothetical protein